MCVTTATTHPCAQGGSSHSPRAAPCHPLCKGRWGLEKWEWGATEQSPLLFTKKVPTWKLPALVGISGAGKHPPAWSTCQVLHEGRAPWWREGHFLGGLDLAGPDKKLLTTQGPSQSPTACKNPGSQELLPPGACWSCWHLTSQVALWEREPAAFSSGSHHR